MEMGEYMNDAIYGDSGIGKFPVYIPGFEFISDGGLPAGRATLITGSSGSGKTAFGAQFLVEGIRQSNEGGVFVTFEEPPAAIRANFHSLGWPIAKWESQGKWAFVDLSPDEEQDQSVGEFDLGALLPRIEHAIKKVNAKRLVIDSMGSLFSQFSDDQLVRRSLGKLISAIRRLEITAIVTAERFEENERISRFGVEEFVADSVIMLRNRLDGDKRRRTIEILKMRGTSHQKGEYPFTVSHDANGVSIIPLSAIELNQPSSTKRSSFGVKKLDAMCDGGLLHNSVTLVTGPTGTGKSLIANHFLTADPDDKSLLIAFEEGVEQLRRNAEGWGLPFKSMENEGKLKIHASYPETANLEDHLIRLKRIIDEFKPKRMVIDSLSALKRISSSRGFREFLIALVAFARESGGTVLMTNNTSQIQSGNMASETQISSMTDTIILLRYFEKESMVKRGLTVLKMRGSNQDKSIREFTISSSGIEIEAPLNIENSSASSPISYL